MRRRRYGNPLSARGWFLVAYALGAAFLAVLIGASILGN